MNILNKVALLADDINIPKVDPANLLKNGLNAFYFIAGAVAVIMIIIAGLQMTTSAGSSDAVAKAKKTIGFAVVGLIVIICAYAITNFVVGLFK